MNWRRARDREVEEEERDRGSERNGSVGTDVCIQEEGSPQISSPSYFGSKCSIKDTS